MTGATCGNEKKLNEELRDALAEYNAPVQPQATAETGCVFCRDMKKVRSDPGSVVCPNCHGTRTVTWRHDDGDTLTGRCPECAEEERR